MVPLPLAAQDMKINPSLLRLGIVQNRRRLFGMPSSHRFANPDKKTKTLNANLTNSLSSPHILQTPYAVSDAAM